MSHIEKHLTIPIIGYHYSPLTQKFGIPRQPNLVSVISFIDLIGPYNTFEAFEGITEFSHLWISWQAHHNHLQSDKNTQAFKAKVRPPRLGGNAKLGVFATRSTYRPSQQGLSVVRLHRIDVKENGSVRLYIIGADMVDGTPILDIKPYIRYSDSIDDALSGYASDKPVVKLVRIKESAQVQFDRILIEGSDEAVQPSKRVNSNQLGLEQQLQQDDIDIICQLISQDPRPAYRQQDKERIYYLRYKQYDIGFKMLKSSAEFEKDSVLQIVSIDTI